ncbi:MAG TPA: hypothetical protein VGB56_02205 [Flavisolibacter sp.]|jgi:hypothetical protein
MRRIALFSLLLLSFNCSSYCQGKKGLNEIAISIPSIWSHVEVTQGNGPVNEKEGGAWGYGLNAAYSRTIFKGFFLTGGLGIFRQNFSLSRPTDYDDGVTSLLYSTSKYGYGCLHSLIGLGYNFPVKRGYFLKGSLTYNQLNTFSQEYTLAIMPPSGNDEVKRSEKYLFGRTYNAALGLRRLASGPFVYGIDAVVPVYTRWRKDPRFREDPAEHYSPRFSAGINISAAFKF